MRRISVAFLVMVIVSILFSGCVVRHGDFTVVSNKMVRLSDFELEKSDAKKGIVGEDVQHWILFFPLSGQPSLEGALDDAFEKGGGDVMTDAVIKSYGWTAILYGKSGWEVKGDVVKTRKY